MSVQNIDKTGGTVGEATEDVERVLQAALDLTRSMTASAEAGEFERTSVLMAEREHTLARAAGLASRALKGTESTLLTSIQEENGRLMSALQEKRLSIVRQLDGVRRERAIAAYRQ